MIVWEQVRVMSDDALRILHVSLHPRWFVPFIGHMGICTSAGIIRDFAGPYVVSVSPVALG